jgi:hypothetical protein
MLKTLKSAAELVALLNAELRKHDICENVTVVGVTPIEVNPASYNWTATIIRDYTRLWDTGSGSLLANLPSCPRFASAKI